MQKILKRTTDIVISLLGLVLAAPVMAVTALAIFVCMGSPVLFRQQRPGLFGVPFSLIKFRTLRQPEKGDGTVQPSQADNLVRVTRLGKFLRQTALDELPQLWNVLKGEMSLVGPRPLFMEYLNFYTPEQMRRHDVKPGITGWAQVNGRAILTWEERFKQDVWYVDNQSFGLDMKILVKTVQRLVLDITVGPPVDTVQEFFTGTRQ